MTFLSSHRKNTIARPGSLSGRAPYCETMKNHLLKEYTVQTSRCDAEGLLGIRNIFDICMDLASEHAGELGVGYYDMLERHAFWVAVRTRIRIYERPRLGDGFSAVTWPGKPGLAKCDRFYRLFRGDCILAEGRTEWAGQDTDTGAVRRSNSFGYPMDLEPLPEIVCAEPFTRFRDADVSGMEPARRYVVDPMDVDVGKHMNNVAYVRMLLGTFSTKEQAAMDVREMEVSYRRACFEGEELFIYRWREEDAWRFEVRRPDGEPAVHALLRVGPESDDYANVPKNGVF